MHVLSDNYKINVVIKIRVYSEGLTAVTCSLADGCVTYLPTHWSGDGCHVPCVYCPLSFQIHRVVCGVAPGHVTLHVEPSQNS